MRTIIILSVSSDIGFYLAQAYLKLGYRVIGTFRSLTHVSQLKKFSHCFLFPLDVHDPQSVAGFVGQLKRQRIRWDTVISSVGEPRPLQAFFKSDFGQWKTSVEVNSLDQLRVVHGLYPLRRKKANMVFFAGGGMNNAVVDFSAYTIGKVMLAKMCEFLDAENPDLNIFIVGPGWTKTKTHELIVKDEQVSSQKKKETLRFLKGHEGTALKDIFDCIHWLCGEGKAVAGGRNFSVVYDPWRGADQRLLKKALAQDKGMYKLKRHGNDFLQQRETSNGKT